MGSHFHSQINTKHTSMRLLSLLPFLPQLFAHGPYNQNAIYLEKNFNWGGMEDSISQALNAGYNRFYVGFYMRIPENGQYSCAGACLDWEMFDSSRKQKVKNMLKPYNATLYLSVGGPGQFWEGTIDNNRAQAFSNAAGAYAKANMYDGIELSMKLSGEGTTPSPYSLDGSFNQLAKDMAIGVKSSGNFAAKRIAISSNAPYFSKQFVSNDVSLSLSELALKSNNQQSWYVQDINLLMFNEDGNYMTYNDMFIKNTYVDPIYGNFGLGSSVQEVIALGINPNYVSVIKPITATESTVRSGYINPVTLGSWGCQAHNKYAWMGGFIGWTWNSSTQDELNTVLQFVANTKDTCDG